MTLFFTELEDLLKRVLKEKHGKLQKGRKDPLEEVINIENQILYIFMLIISHILLFLITRFKFPLITRISIPILHLKTMLKDKA